MMPLCNFISVFTWLGPPSLKINREMPPADIVIRHIFMENFMNVKLSTDLATWYGH
jgi:hypothetical protein